MNKMIKRMSWLWGLVAAAALLLACSTLTGTPSTSGPMVVVTQIVEVTRMIVVTPLPDALVGPGDEAGNNNSNNNATGQDQPEIEMVTVTPGGFNPTRPPLPTPTAGPTQPPLLPGESDFSAEDIDQIGRASCREIV